MKASDKPCVRDLFLQAARDQLDEQFRLGRGMDSRAATVGAIASAFAGVAAVLLKDFSGAEAHGPPTVVTVLAAIVAVA